jgi:hypothetical protein
MSTATGLLPEAAMNTAPHPDEASDALARIRSSQQQVIRTALIPVWYWWAVAVGMVVMGGAADTKKPVMLGLAIPVAALCIAALTLAMIFGLGRGARIKSDELLGTRGALLIVGFVWLIVGLTLGLGFGLRAAGTPAPATIATAAGAILLGLTGPALNRRLNKIMLSNRAGLSNWTAQR